MTHQKSALSVLLLTLIVSWASNASAFCRALACSKDDPKLACIERDGECPSGRPALFWPSSCISFGFQQDASKKYGIDYDSANQIANAAFSSWRNADCGAGQHPSFDIIDMGPIECNRHEYQKNGNANILMFTDDEWPFDDPKRDIALTLTSFDTRTGEIYDADIAINSANMQFSTDEMSAAEYDLSSVLTHEIGHFLGLGHSTLHEATMRVSYGPGSKTIATLHQDDIAGICELFPPGNAVSHVSCFPRHGFSDQCGGRDDEEETSCSLRALPATPRAPTWFLGAGIVGAFLLLRRRMKSPKHG